jgi:adenylosuccinate synthase
MKKKELKLLENVNTVAISCRQWGDTGKGKFVDIFAEWADIIVRGTGGDNAGHTVVFNGQELVTHLVPSGILRKGKTNIIGNGTVVYPKALVEEIIKLEEKGIDCHNLKLAHNAKIILPTEILLDRLKEVSAGSGKIGSTGKGIGPTYTDFVGREGLIVNDLLNPTFFREKFKRHLKYKLAILKTYDSELIKTILDHEHLESGFYFDSENYLNFEAVCEKYLAYGEKLKSYICDTDSFVRSNLGERKILLEGAQGDMLSIDHGSYPFVTSSDCTVAGLAKGAGLRESDIDLSLGIIKGFYMTRVGAGPFPTELGGEQSDSWCNGGKINKAMEKALYHSTPKIDGGDEFLEGVVLRIAGNEYGATTGRPRRTGWLDLPLLRYTLGFNSPDLILTKLDVLNDCDVIKVCNHYKYTGENCVYAGQKILSGKYLETAVPQSEIMKFCKPIYVKFPGWKCDLKDCRDYGDLPEELKHILEFITKETKARPRIISVGADREETIFL